MKISFVPAQAGLASILTAMLVFAVADSAEAGCGCAACVSSCQTYQTIEKTIYVPQMVPETRIVNETICEPEVRERVVTVCRQVPETRQVTQNYTVMVPQQRKGTQSYVVCKPVYSDVEQSYTVSIPQTETRTGVRNVCRPVQVQETRTVTRNVCAWEDVPCDGSCGGHSTIVQKGDFGVIQKGVVQKGGETIVQKSSGCGGTHRVMRNQCITEEVPVTVWKNEMHQEEYSYNVTTYRPETRTRTVRVCNYVNETQTREVTYTVCVPEQRTQTVNVTSYKTISEQQTQQYTVMVPRTVQREVTVNVCHMVPQQVTCTVPVLAPAYGCGGHYYGCHGRRCCY
ncbi:MAG: hypothetical protein H6822_17015 [Planctomycetaceae bacterium]|nr:hypothetical protein [Planctomycetales bacterium]MCB9923886.1 hypothetical protein [Planctomycetaceae bacterium]